MPLHVRSQARGSHETVQLKPRTFTVRRFREGEPYSQFGDFGIWDGDEFLGLADIWPDGKEKEAEEKLASEVRDFLRSPERARAGTAQRLFDEMVFLRMSQRAESFGVAERSAILTEDGRSLWERARIDRLKEEE